MCTGRVDLAFVLRAFEKGADGVIIGGCWPGECHYVTEGNYDALGNMYVAKKLLDHIGLAPERLRLEWIAASEGTRFAEVMSDFANRLRALGPLGQGEGLDDKAVARRLSAASRLVPYVKLVEREKLRIPVRTEEAYDSFYAGAEADRLFRELVGDKVTVSQILLLLGEEPQSTSEIAAELGLTPSEVARHVGCSSNEGLVRYDQERGSYALA